MSQKTQPTPGPWHVSESGFEVRCVDTVGDSNVTVAACYAPALPEAERKANAAFIAAAPELLAACQMALEYAVSPAFLALHGDAPEKQLRAAIAKASGESLKPTTSTLPTAPTPRVLITCKTIRDHEYEETINRKSARSQDADDFSDAVDTIQRIADKYPKS